MLGIAERRVPRKRRRQIVGIDRLPAIFVINLARRTDRMRRFDEQIARLGIVNAVRFEAVEHANPILGCALSHIACLRWMLSSGWRWVMVCEDDLRFTVGREALDALVDAFLDDPRAEVACFQYSHRAVERHSLLYLRATATETRACYLVKETIARDLIEVWEHGAAALASGGDRHTFSGDRIWRRLQQDRVFVIPIVRAGRQMPGYSDLWQCHVEPIY